MLRVLGIDFGTSTTVMRVKRYQANGEPVNDPLHVDSVTFDTMGSTTVPTLIQCEGLEHLNGDRVFFGYDALISRKGMTLFDRFKMLLDSDRESDVEKGKALTARFFKYLFSQYSAQSQGSYLGDLHDEEMTLVSYPVKWREDIRRFMLKAAEEAGFRNVQGMNEAEAVLYAAAMSPGQKAVFESFDRPFVSLIVDMGAGTTDLCLTRNRVIGGRLESEELACWPTRTLDVTLGGSEIDDLLLTYFKEKARSAVPQQDAANTLLTMMQDKRAEFQKWKEIVLSDTLRQPDGVVTDCTVLDALIDQFNMYSPVTIPAIPYERMDRAWFENIAREYLAQYPKMLRDCLQAAGIGPEEVDVAILTGGHSQWYFAADVLLGRSAIGSAGMSRLESNEALVMPLVRPREVVSRGMVFSRMPLMAAEQQKPVLEKAVPTSQPVPAAGPASAQLDMPPAPTAGPASAQKGIPSAPQAAQPSMEPFYQFARAIKGKMHDGRLGCVSAGQKQLRREGRLDRLCNRLRVPPGEPVYMYCDSSTLGNGNDGFAMTSRGIYQYGIWGEVSFASWAEFERESIRIEPDKTVIKRSGYDNGFGLVDSSCHAAIRELFARLNGHSEAAKPVQAAASNSLLRILHRFSEEIAGKNHGGRLGCVAFGQKQLSRDQRLDNLCKRLHIPSGEPIYMYCDDSTLGNGNDGFVMTSRGIYQYGIWGQTSFAAWDEFVAEKIRIEPNGSEIGRKGFNNTFYCVDKSCHQAIRDLFIRLNSCAELAAPAKNGSRAD